MTQQERLYLEKGRIPAWIVLSEIEVHLAKYEDEEGTIDLLAERGQISSDTIYTWLGQRRVQSIEFDVADRLLLATVGPLWALKYEDYYYGVNLNFKKCECPGCEVMIEVTQRTSNGGGVVAKYCSRTCRQVAYHIRSGKTKSRQKRHLTGMTKCRRGHPRTPENIKRRSDGRIECMECARQNARDRRAAAKAAA